MQVIRTPRKGPTMSNMKYIRGSLRSVACAVLAVAASTAQADDIDIFASPSADSTAPNMLFWLDNTSNWSANNQAWDAASMWTDPTKCKHLTGAAYTTCRNNYQADSRTKDNIEKIFYYGIPTSGVNSKKRPWESGFRSNTDNVSLTQGQVEVRSLRLVLTDLICTPGGASLKLNAGLMMFNENGTVRSNGDRSGYIRRAVKLLSGTPTTAGSTCKAIIDDLTLFDQNITDPLYKGPSNADYGSAMFEAFKYFGGFTNPSLVQSNTAGSPAGAAGYGSTRYALRHSLEDPDAFTDTTRSTYRSPIDVNGSCGRSYLVLVGNGWPNAEPYGPATFNGINYTPTSLPGGGSQVRYADEWSQFLANTDVSAVDGVQRVYTYTLNVYKDQPNADQTALLKNMATYGGIGPSAYLEVGGDLTAMIESLKEIITTVAAVNSAFTATTLPVSTTTQGSYLNQLYIGMFRPDGDAKPRWVGNLKQYQLGLGGDGDVSVVDATGKSALTGGTGFFAPGAISFWTEDSVFFTASPSGTPASSSDKPDGQIVEKGGAAQKLRTHNLLNASGRKVYTLPANPTGGALLSGSPFATSNTTVAAAFTTAEIQWVRGENNLPAGSSGAEFAGAYKNSAGESVFLGNTGARPSIHGDILHSRPVALNYGNDDVVVYYGSNDGFLRAVDGRKTGATAGQELWSFVAPEHYGILKRQRDNSPELYLPSTNAAGTPAGQVAGTQKKDYAMDGPIGVFGRYSSGGSLEEGIIYVSMRRGGSSVYAFDVTNKTAPKFLWKISPTTPGFEKLAQTWSMARPIVFPTAYSADPIIVMGGGYDPAEDTNTSGNIGNVVYVINGRTGVRLATLNTDFSVPGDISVADTNDDRVVDRGYLADVRGRVYRINMTDAAGTLLPPASWTITKIGNVGGKVFFAPDVVVARNFVGVFVGTGDREKPLMISSNDHFVMLKDTKLGQEDRTSVPTIANLAKVAHVDEQTFELVQADLSNQDASLGCYIKLSTKGEKVVNAPFTIAGATYFGTNRPTPSANSCTGSLGEARGYQFPVFCGAPSSSVFEGGGLPPSPVGGVVSMEVDGKKRLVRFLIGGGKKKSTGGSTDGSNSSRRVAPFEATTPDSPAGMKLRRTFWHVDDGTK